MTAGPWTAFGEIFDLVKAEDIASADTDGVLFFPIRRVEELLSTAILKGLSAVQSKGSRKNKITF
jgi:hypothetical protein